MTNPCDIWKKALSNPKDADAVKAAREHLADLMAHVRNCDPCLAVGDEHVENAEALFDALGVPDAELTEQERAEIEAIEQAWSDNEGQIEKAVENVLLNGVPALPQVDGPMRHLDAFLAINAINLLVFNRIDPQSGPKPVLTPEGLMEGGALTVPVALLVSQIRRHAPLSEAAAQAMYRWSLTAADWVPGLFLQFRASKTPHGIELTLDAPSLRHNLNTRWVPRVRLIDVMRGVEASNWISVERG